MGQVAEYHSQTQQGQPIIKLETPTHYPSWECQHEARAIHKKKQVQSGIVKEGPRAENIIGKCVLSDTLVQQV